MAAVLEIASTWRRFHIMGGAGSGKTTLARELHARLGYPLYELDWIAWTKQGKVPLNERMAALDRIIAQPAWITEGAFLWWTDPLLDNADVIVWLDLPFRISGWRMIKRHAVLSWRGTNPHPGLLNLIDFIAGIYRHHRMKTPLVPKSVDDDFSITRAATAEILAQRQEKLVHCVRPRDVAVFLARASADAERTPAGR